LGIFRSFAYTHDSLELRQHLAAQSRHYKASYVLRSDRQLFTGSLYEKAVQLLSALIKIGTRLPYAFFTASVLK
jgi:hypothetical protein